jgi:hypothetical protein
MNIFFFFFFFFFFLRESLPHNKKIYNKFNVKNFLRFTKKKLNFKLKLSVFNKICVKKRKKEIKIS